MPSWYGWVLQPCCSNTVNEYTKEKENNGVSVVVKDYGFFFVSSAYGFLGASSDGLITEHDGTQNQLVCWK